MRTKDRIYKIYNKITNRLSPEHDVGIKTYVNIYSLFKGYARSSQTFETYNQLTKYYDNYFKKLNRKTMYIKSKYRISKTYKSKAKRAVFDIVAIATTPIILSVEAFKRTSNRTIAYYLLHEIGHIVLKTVNERKCDLYARRWTKQLIKEKVIK